MKKYQKAIDDWARTLEEPYWPPLSQFARVAEEVGELGRLLIICMDQNPRNIRKHNKNIELKRKYSIFNL